jgi:alpha-tubulin suppressor-like RCC1 family protein
MSAIMVMVTNIASAIRSAAAVITPTGTTKLWTWGRNQYGQLGLSDTITRSSPTQVGSGNTWSMIAGTQFSTAAIKTDGTLWTWGLNYYGSLGDNTSILFRSSPVQIGTNTNWSQIVADSACMFAIKTDGTLWTWGIGGYGGTAQNDRVYRSSPTQVGNQTWSNISGNLQTILAIKTDGTLWGWGNNQQFQLGLNSGGSYDRRSSPVQIGTNTNWSKVSAHDDHTFAIKTDGTLWSWGANYPGQLGQNDRVYRSSPTQVGSATNWNTVSEREAHVLATKTDGTLWTWGQNNNGQLGLNDRVNRSSPTQVGTGTNWNKVFVSEMTDSASLATKIDGTLWSWGYGDYGELGSNSWPIYRSSPVQIGTGTTWSQLYGGREFIAAITDDNYSPPSPPPPPPPPPGSLYTWGRNNTGSLALNDQIHRSSPTQVGSTAGWSKINKGYFGALAIKTDGTLWSWGNNQFGALGLSTVWNDYKSSPVQIGALTNWSKVGTSNYGNFAIKQDGTLWSWGYNGAGVLGLNDINHRSSPTQVGTSTNWSHINLNRTSVVSAIKTDGTLWMWGYNYGDYYLGGILGYRSSPTQVGTSTNWLISSSDYASSAIKTDGTLWTWGSNIYGATGLNMDTGNVNSPTQIGTGTNWSQISTGIRLAGAIKTDGTLWTWGRNNFGQLGIGANTDKSSPTQVAGTTWNLISMGSYYHAAAIKTDGTLWTWGRNNWGQLGINLIGEQLSPVQVGTGTTWNQIQAASQTSFAIKD